MIKKKRVHGKIEHVLPFTYLITSLYVYVCAFYVYTYVVLFHPFVISTQIIHSLLGPNNNKASKKMEQFSLNY
jgi:hypothetical protein